MSRKQFISTACVALYVFFLSKSCVPSVFATYDCSQFKDALSCEGRTGRGCEWKEGKCIYDVTNIDKPVEQGLASENFKTIDPLQSKFDSVGSIVGSLLPWILTAAGLVLFAMLIMGGFDFMTAGTDAKKAEAGKGRITAAIIGFVIIFAAYWIVQILEIVLGISILK